ncbi:MAG: PQQ-like beta-propeller repeat protein [Candidatus Hydrogenedentes bacterium]|nr:PQQ-like beta-propeller repeat protein [Candidatus Hydrogenedentota bacterium]
MTRHRLSSSLAVVLGGVLIAWFAHAGTLPATQWTYEAGSPIYASPVVADFLPEHPGQEILTVSSSKREVVCLGADGKSLWNYGGFTLRLTATPTVAPLNAGGALGIFVATRNDGVVCLNAKGELAWKQPVPEGIPWGNVTAGGPDPSSNPRLFWINLGGLVECHDVTGAKVWETQFKSRGPEGPLAVGDVDGDGQVEVLTGGGAALRCLDSAGHEKWRFDAPSEFNNGPVLTDVLGNGRIQVLAASKDGVLYCLDGKTGKPIWNHRTFQCRIDSTVAVGDIDGDAKPEVVYGDGQGRLYCLNNLGEERWSFKAGDWIESAPVLGDVDGDASIDVVFGSADGNVYSLSAKGDLEWTFTAGKRVSASPTLCDCNGDGITDILVPSHNGKLYNLTAGGRWDPNRILWPCRRYDLAQTAHVPKAANP